MIDVRPQTIGPARVQQEASDAQAFRRTERESRITAFRRTAETMEDHDSRARTPWEETPREANRRSLGIQELMRPRRRRRAREGSEGTLEKRAECLNMSAQLLTK